MPIPQWVDDLAKELEAKERNLYAKARTFHHYRDAAVKAQYNLEASNYANFRKRLLEAAEAAEQA